MKKERYLDVKGFMLVETLLVSLTIAGILIYMYAQFSTINDTYQKLYNYNTTNGLYHTDVIRQFMLMYTTDTTSSNIYIGTNGLINKKAINITNCNFDSSLNYSTRSYCSDLVKEIDAKHIILTWDDFNNNSNKNAIINLLSDKKDKANMEKFLKQIKSTNDGMYRIIIVYKNGEIATLLYDFSD